MSRRDKRNQAAQERQEKQFTSLADVAAAGYGDVLSDLSQIESEASGNAIVFAEDGQSLTYGKAQLSQTGIANIGELDESDLDSLGNLLFAVDDAVQWWIGDWLNRMPRAWGTTYEAVAERTGRDVATLYNYANVSRKIDFSLRNENLSFSHHMAVAMLAHQEQRYWLELAEREGLSVRKLREAIKKNDAPEDPLDKLPVWEQPAVRAFNTYRGKWKKMTVEQRQRVYRLYKIQLEEMERWGIGDDE